LKKKEDQKRKKIKNNLSSHTREPKIKKNSKLKWKPKDSRSRRRGRSNASENFKKKLLIVKQKSMPFVPSVLLRRGRDRLVSVKD
jgi:hypothetical protein